MSKIRFVLFDFDGVISDTEKSNAAYLQRALSHYGISLTEKEWRSLLGINDPSRVKQFLRHADPPVDFETFYAYRNSLGNTYENGELELMPGLLPVLRELRQREIGTALVSSTSSHLIEAGLNQLGLTSYFDVVICGDMVQNRKPDPEPYLRAIQFMDARPQECLVIEDSPVGIRAGKAAGALVIGFCGSEISQDISQSDYRLDSFWDFFKLPICFF